VYKIATDGAPKYHLKLLSGDEDVNTLPTVDESMIVQSPILKRRSWSETHNEIRSNYTEIIGSFPYAMPDAENLVLHYLFNETTGTTFADETDNGYDGVYWADNVPFLISDGHIVPGVHGNAVDFISTCDSHLTTGEDLFDTWRDSFAISFWFNADDGIPAAPNSLL